MGTTTLKGSRRVLRSFDDAASRRAIYVDYEGNKNAEPTLVGWRVDGIYHAAIVETSFGPCAGRHRAREPVAASHEDAVRVLLQSAIEGDRAVVSWSVHDLKLLHAVLGRHEQARLLERYVNALDIARPWHRRVHGHTAPGGARLAYFACLFGIAIPAKYGELVVGTNLSALRRLLVAGRQYRDFSAEQKKRWVTVVKHNKADLGAMEGIVRAIVRQPNRGTAKSPGQCA
jgi:hypothetical protein